MPNKNRHGKAFERQLLLSLRTIPNSYSDRHPGRVMSRGRGIRYINPKIDLLFMSPSLILSIECKATKNKVFYFSQGMKPGQVDSLRAFSRIGERFDGVIAIHFVRFRKVVIIDNLSLTKVTPDMPGIKKVKGVWQIREYIDERKELLRKKKPKDTKKL